MCPTVQFNADLYSVCSLVLLKLYLIKGPNYNVKVVLHHMEAWLVGVNGQEMGKSSFEWTRNNSISIEIWIWMRQKSWYCVVWNTPHPPTHPRPLFPRSDVTISSQALDQGDGTELLRLRRFSQNSQERTPSLQILVDFPKTKKHAISSTFQQKSEILKTNFTILWDMAILGYYLSWMFSGAVELRYAT